jgi:hypothetical protein
MQTQIFAYTERELPRQPNHVVRYVQVFHDTDGDKFFLTVRTPTGEIIETPMTREDIVALKEMKLPE